jgi:CRP/FNR family transcriptional regulator
MRRAVVGRSLEAQVVAKKKAAPSPVVGRPFLRARPFGPSATGGVGQLLTEPQQQQLAALSTVVKIARKTLVYEGETPARSIWIVDSGVVKSYRALANGRSQIMGFLFPGDLFGLAQNGNYVNTTRAVTPVILHRLPREALTEVLRRDPELEFQFLMKAAHELRELQRRAIVVGRRDATGRIAMFMSMLCRNEYGKDVSQRRIRVPMTRSDVAEYLNLTPEAVSRGCQQLARGGILAFPNRHTPQIVDLERFEQLISHA